MSDKDEKRVLSPSTLENIDMAMFEWLDEEIDAFARTNKGWKKVPVIWTGEERVHQVKQDRDIRDDNGALIFPLITLRRTSKTKSLTSKGVYQADIPELDDSHKGSVPFTRRINQSKTSDYEKAEATEITEGNQINFETEKKNDDVIYQTAFIQQPVYIDITYQIVLRTDFQEQMNQVVTPLVNYPGAINHFVVERNGWKYECFFQEDFSEDNNTAGFDEEERSFKTTIDIRTLGYLIGDDKNEPGAEITIRENAVNVAFEESVVTGSFNDIL